MIGPLVAGALAVAVGFTASVHVAVLAAVCVLAVRLLEDYVVDAEGARRSRRAVAAPRPGLRDRRSAILFSGWAVLFAVPIAAVATTLFDVVLRDVDPAEEDVPAVIFSPKEAEA